MLRPATAPDKASEVVNAEVRQFGEVIRRFRFSLMEEAIWQPVAWPFRVIFGEGSHG
jgi:hypothetical protein